jgi:predicted lactoylglutathione lyase
VIPRQKFFSWLLLNGKLNSKEMMLKKTNYVEFSECILCDTNTAKSIIHLFSECSFTQSFWWALGFEWNIDLDIDGAVLMWVILLL